MAWADMARHRLMYAAARPAWRVELKQRHSTVPLFKLSSSGSRVKLENPDFEKTFDVYTPMTATVKQYGGWAAITDVLQLTAIDNNITQATKVLASQAGRTLDTVTREVLAGGTNVIYAPAGDTAVTSRANLTTASVLTPDLIDQAATALKAQNADAIGESYVAIVHPYVAYDLRRNPEWIDVHKYASPENIYNGEIGKLAGVRFIESYQNE